MQEKMEFKLIFKVIYVKKQAGRGREVLIIFFTLKFLY